MKCPNVWQNLKRASYSTSLYKRTLKNSRPTILQIQLDLPLPGDPKAADHMFQGRYRFNGREARAPNQPPWRLRTDDKEWMTSLHQFDWLGHFRTVGGISAKMHAQKLVQSWIESCSDYNEIIWSPSVIGRRLTMWIGLSKFLLDGVESSVRQVFTESLYMQWRHLCRTWADTAVDRSRINALLGLVYGVAAIYNGDQKKLEIGIKELLLALDVNTFEDGIFRTRNPSEQLEIIRDLICLNELLTRTYVDKNNHLEKKLKSMANGLQYMCSSDGALSLFNGSYETSPKIVSNTLRQLNHKNRVTFVKSPSGLHRISAEDKVLIFDSGNVPITNHKTTYAGAGSFEFSIGRHRLITNCGGGNNHNKDWQIAVRQTAAHSSPNIDDEDNLVRTATGWIETYPKQKQFTYEQDTNGGIKIDLVHDGYLTRYNLLLRRTILFLAGGNELRGEDIIWHDKNYRAKSKRGRELTVRFHLHPNVQASAVQGGNAVLLRVSDRHGWWFNALEGAVALEESVYLGKPDVVRRSQQVVIRSKITQAKTSTKWTLRRV